MKHISLIIFSLFIIFSGFSQSINKEIIDSKKLDAYFQALETNNKFMGSVAIIKNGDIIYRNQIGFSDVSNSIKPDSETKYRIGSISKTFTAVLVFKTIEAGKLSLNQSIKEYFPKIKNSSKITISNLLNHRSGIHNFTANDEYLTYNTKAQTEEQMLKIIIDGKSDFKPNSKAEYSNSNYVLLAYILEKIYSKSYSDILNDSIIKPLNLRNTYAGNMIDVKNNEALSYSFDKAWKMESETDMSIPIGAGSIVSTPTDLLLFSKALFNNTLVSKKSVAQMITLEDNYGRGLFKMPFYDMFSFGHTGGIDGFTSVQGYFIDQKCGMAIVSNGSIINQNDVALVLLSALFDKDYKIPSFKTHEITSEDLDKYIGIYKSSSFPMDITISKKGNTMVAQATGQSSFPLDATEKNIFKFDAAGITLKFNPELKQMTLLQGGAEYVLTRE